MPSHAVAYKQAAFLATEAVELNEDLWDHIHAARSFAEQQDASRSTPTAFVVRPPAGEPVIVVLMDYEPQALPDAEELCLRFNLTPREAEVALLLADRMSCREIAQRLKVSFHTARSHTERIIQKLDVARKHDVRQRLLTGKPHLTVMASE